MTTTPHTSILPSLDDIVFEGRNKAYGAYVLRRVYGEHMRKALMLAIALAALLISIPMAVRYFFPPLVVVPEIPLVPPTTVLTDVHIADPITTPPAARPIAVVQPPKDVAPQILPDELVKPDTKPVEVITNNDATPGTTVGPIAGEAVDAGVLGGTGKDTSAKVAEPAVTKPFLHVEEMPDFIGGQAALVKYLQRNLKYPSNALREGVSGRVFVAFTVNSDGSIADVEILKGLGYGTEEEAARVIKAMPSWKPGRQNNRAVPVRYTLPITFHYE